MSSRLQTFNKQPNKLVLKIDSDFFSLKTVKILEKYLPKRTFSVGILSSTAFVGNLLSEIPFQDATNAHNPQDHVVIRPVSQSFPVSEKVIINTDIVDFESHLSEILTDSRSLTDIFLMTLCILTMAILVLW